MKSRGLHISLIAVALMASACDNEDSGFGPGAGTSSTDDPGAGSVDAPVGVKTINGDSSDDHRFTVVNSGTLGFSTSGGTTTLSIPNADGSTSGLLSSSDFSDFQSKLSTVSQDSAPSLGGNLDVSSHQIVSQTNGDVRISPDGTGELVVNKAINRMGFAQVYLDVTTAIPNGAGLSLQVPFTQQSRIDTEYYTHDGGGASPHEITIVQDGNYRISFNLTIQQTTVNVRHNWRSWVEADGAEIIPSKAYCYTRNSSTDFCSTVGTMITTLTAGQVLQFRTQGTRNGTWGVITNTASVLADESWVLIEKI